MLSITNPHTMKQLIFTATRQTGSSFPRCHITDLPTIRPNEERAHIANAHVTRSDREKSSFLLAVRRTRTNVRSLDKSSELEGDKSAGTIRGYSPWW